MRRWFVVGFAVVLGGILGLYSAPAQQSSAQKLTGTWQHVAGINTRDDGTKFYPFGEHPTGLLMFDDGGNFAWQIIRPDTPKFASNNRLQGTPDEFKAVAQGVLAFYGTYTVDDAQKTVVMRIVSSSFPNFTGVEQKRAMTITGDELTLVNQAGSSGGSAETRWKRIK